MSKRRAAEFPPQILDIASTWFVEFNEGDVDAATREEFIQWLRTSPEHLRAYLQISAHWEDAHVLSNTQKLTTKQLVALGRGEGNIVSLDRAIGSIFPRESTVEIDGRQGSRPTLVSAQRNSRLRPFVAVAASAVLAVLSLWLYNQRNVYSTDIGEQRSIKLADGSSVELNSRSRVRIDFNEAERSIELLEGQALFQVAKDKTRPFIVRSSGTRVRALGTQFDVYKKSTGTIVTVVEGRVAVITESINPIPYNLFPSPAADFHGVNGRKVFPAERESKRVDPAKVSSAIELSAGEQLTVTNADIKNPSTADISAATAWTQKQIIFRDTPLTDVVQEFNRYNTRQMVITDPSIKAVRISGSFSSTDPASLLRGLDAMSAFVVHESSEQIELSAR